MRFTVKYPEFLQSNHGNHCNTTAKSEEVKIFYWIKGQKCEPFHLSTRGPKKHSKASAKGMEEEQCKPANMDVNSAGAIVVKQI